MSGKHWVKGLLSLGFFLLLLTAGAASGQEDRTLETVKPDVLKSWDELMHYAMLGNWELAQNYGKALIDLNPEPQDLLLLAESDRYANSYRNLSMMQANTPLAELAAAILKLVEEGRFQRRTDTVAIVREVKRLSGTTRGRMLAIERLKDSGEWAVPVMINVLRDTSRSDEVSLIRWALPQIGRPAVNPLVVVLQKNPALNIQVIVLDALGKIGYRSALPYIKEILENSQSSPELKAVAQEAYAAIVGNDTGTAFFNAADLFYGLAEDYYNEVPSLAPLANEENANIWFWQDKEGLYKEQVPRGAFNELMAMRACEDAIRLEPAMADAIALWQSAFFRLEAQGFAQPAYFGEHHADAATYALTAGPEYLQRTLARALDNRNRPVALAAIQALRRNSGQQSLLFVVGQRQPLIEALNYPDREIRFSAALTIGASLPAKPFEKSEFVVPIIGEALRQQGQRCAIVIDNDQNRRNNLVAQLRTTEKFAQVVSGDNFNIALEQAQDFPSIDIVILDAALGLSGIQDTLKLMQGDYRLAFCPTLVISNTLASHEVDGIKAQSPFVDVVLADSASAEMLQDANAILERNQARAFAQELGDKYAADAAEVLLSLAVTDNRILPPVQALKALLPAIRDTRPVIQQAVLQTLARLDSTDAQRAIADFALDDKVELNTRLLALNCLAISAKSHGQLLLMDHIDALYAIVGATDQDPQLRNLAAQAYGALNLPSAKVSQLILDQVAQ